MYKSVRIDEEGHYDSTPTYLFDYPELYRSDPNEAALQWFTDARFSLAFDCGLHSLLGKGKTAMRDMNIQPENYENLMDTFKLDHFDPIDMVQLTIAAGARALELTVKGPDGFCLWGTTTTDFNVVNSPAKRDILAEIASTCEYEGLGLFLRFSLGDDGHQKSPLESEEYFDMAMTQIKEILTEYGPVAAVNFDCMDNVAADPAKYRIQDFYRYVRNLQPQTLVSFQHGVTGDEDFFSSKMKDDPKGYLAKDDIKPLMLRDSTTPDTWGYDPEFAGRHLSVERINDKLRAAAAKQAHLLLNVNLMPDGSLDLEDINSLLEVGKRIQSYGFPA